MSIRNWIFDIGLKPIYQSNKYVISVGNIAMGGTGKSPMVAYLIDYFSSKHINTATVSRGYGRETKGLIWANEKTNPKEIGDEPFQIYTNMPKSNAMIVSEKRTIALELLQKNQNYPVVILDDAYQHRYVSRNFNIILTSYHSGFWNDFVLPAGNLREKRTSVNRADCVIVTKCPDQFNESEIKNNIYQYFDHSKPIFFTKMHYQTPKNKNKESLISKNVIGIAGLANNHYFKSYLEDNFQLKDFFSFSDHHFFTQSDIDQISISYQKNNILNSDLMIITTEKDFAKLISNHLKWKIELNNFFYLPITIEFLENEADFLNLILANDKNK